MAKKNILVSDNNGKYQPISASIDNDNGEISSSLPLTLNTASFIGQNELMQVFNKQLIPVLNTSSIQNEPAGGSYSGSVLSYSSLEGFGPHRKDTAAFSGDISGDLVTGVKVRSVTNVTGGILPLTYGGTGQSSFASGSLITTSGSGPVYGQTNKSVISNGTQFTLVDDSLVQFTPMTGVIVYLYTGSYGITDTFTWTKPSGCRFVKVMCQGGGGAGGKTAGGGGGGGGYSETIFNATSMPNTVTVTVGAGGAGAIWSGTATSGGNSSFGSYIIAYGGAVGVGTDPEPDVPNAGGVGGIGFTNNGGVGGVSAFYNQSGGSGRAANGGNAIRAPGGGGGGGLRATTIQTGGNGGTATLVSLAGGAGKGSQLRGLDGSTASYYENIKVYINNNISNLITAPTIIGSAGGGGGGGSYSPITGYNSGAGGGDGFFGAGGGGSGFYSRSASVRSGNGGPGYVLIICY